MSYLGAERLTIVKKPAIRMPKIIAKLLIIGAILKNPKPTNKKSTARTTSTVPTFLPLINHTR